MIKFWFSNKYMCLIGNSKLVRRYASGRAHSLFIPHTTINQALTRPVSSFATNKKHVFTSVIKTSTRPLFFKPFANR